MSKLLSGSSSMARSTTRTSWMVSMRCRYLRVLAVFCRWPMKWSKRRLKRGPRCPSGGCLTVGKLRFSLYRAPGWSQLCTS